MSMEGNNNGASSSSSSYPTPVANQQSGLLTYPASPPGNNHESGLGSTRLTLEAVRARTKRRTEFALRVIEASKAALAASDAILAASDALLSTDVYVYSSSGDTTRTSNASFLQSSDPVAPEASAVSDSESSETESSSFHRKLSAATGQEQSEHAQDDKIDTKTETDTVYEHGSAIAQKSENSTEWESTTEHIIQQALSTKPMEEPVDVAANKENIEKQNLDESVSDNSYSSSMDHDEDEDGHDEDEEEDEESEIESTTNHEDYSEGADTDDHVKVFMREAQSHSLLKDNSMSMSIVSGSFDTIPTAIDAPSNIVVPASNDSVAANSMDDTSKANNLNDKKPADDSDLSSAASDHKTQYTTLKVSRTPPIHKAAVVPSRPADIVYRPVDDNDEEEEEEEESSDDSNSSEDSQEDAPSEQTEKSATSSDVEADPYVDELLNELQATESPSLSATTSRIPPSPPVHPSASLGQSDEMVYKEGSDDSDDDSSDSDSSSDIVSSTGSGADDEDDGYVDELLQELQTTKPSRLVSQRSLAIPKDAPQTTPSPTSQAPNQKTTTLQDSGLATSRDDATFSDDSDMDSSIYDSEEDFSDSDSSDSSDDDDRMNHTTSNHTSSEEFTSDDEEDDEFVDELLDELRAPKLPPPKQKGSPAQSPGLSVAANRPAQAPPVPPVGAAPLPSEGLNLETIRAELEKVGRAVMTQKSGEAFVARAQVLASINQLSSHVPNCVLDFLGKEIRAHMEKEAKKKMEPKRKREMVDAVSTDDDMSEVSELSEADVGTGDGDDDSDVGFFVDTAEMTDGDKAKAEGAGSKEQPDKSTPALMRRKSEEALDEIFNKSQDGSFFQTTSSEEALEEIFASSNEYGFSKSSDERALATASHEGTKSTGSSKRKSRSRSFSSAGSITWGFSIEGRLPSVSRFECALLFVDISGFTKLSTLLDPETLSKVINSYFQLIVSKIYEFNGDIQKFAGDAIFAEWRCDDKHSMEFCVASATACASQIVDECSDFPVMASGTARASTTGEPISSLNVHCALGAGQMIGIHVGDHTRRREYLFLGEPIDQLTWGADLAKHGEFVVSPEAFRLLSGGGVLDFSVKPSESEPAILAKRDVTMFKSEFLKEYRVSQIEYARSRGVTNHVEGLQVDDLKQYQKLMALYVHPVVAAIHMDTTSKIKSKSSAQERHREEAELRRVYIMFIHPLITMNEDNEFGVETLNEIMNLTSTQLERYSGHLRQMIVDDKGLVLIGTFGLRGSTFPNMVSERALPATIALHNALQSQLGVDNRIGATFGEVYCGAVGGVKRHEYAVLGPSANLAARLMGSKNNPGILVDCAIRRMASRKYAFNALPPVKAKGYSEPVPIFEPLSPLERSWGRIQPNFVGREQEIKSLMGMARDIVSSDKPHSRLVFVASQSGMGKSTMVAHAIEHIRNLIGDSTRRLVITKHVGKESYSLLPFGMFRSILLNVLANFAASTDDKSHASGGSGLTSQSISLYSLSCKSQGSSTALSLAKSEELLKVLCRELNAPSGFVDHLLHHLNGKGNTAEGPSVGKAPSMKSMVSFMTRAFKRCTQETKLVVIAMDDCQLIDEMSWKVLRQVFEGTDNVLMICAFDLSRSRDLKVESDFWQVLNGKYRPSGHFVPMELGGLGKEEITQMTMKTLGLQREEISSDLLNEVLIQSGGMPHFANEFLEMVKRRHFTAMMEGGDSAKMTDIQTGSITGTRMGSVPEIILHRIDSFDVAVRNILNIGAVLGKSFTLKEVTAVLRENHDMKEEDLKKETMESLDTAIAEGILRIEETPEEEEQKDDDKTGNISYTFYHSIWQSTILSLMLDSRKRDVHKKIALSMEAQKDKVGNEFSFQMKLLGHWKCGGNMAKLSELAIEIGKHFEVNLGLPTQSIRIYEEALDAWKDENDKEKIGIIGMATLNASEEEDLGHIAKLYVALGQAHSTAERNADSALCFQDALKVLRVPRASSDVSDRSIIFPAYSGLIEAAKAEHIIQEEGKLYEQVLLKRFLEETKGHEDKSHHVHAITCQVDLFRRYGEMAKAVAVHSVLYNLYNFSEHSRKLRDTYGRDDAAVSFSNSAVWHLQLGNKETALDACRYVIGKLMPKMDRSDVHQSFVMMYPVVLVMKDMGVAVQARKHFDRLVVQPFGKFFGEGKSSFFLPVYEPIMLLLHLAGSSDLDQSTLEEYTDWALDRDRLFFGTLANRRLGVLGRCADSLSAEICFLLAERIEDEKTKRALLQNGKEIGEEALTFNRQQGLAMAEQQVNALLSKYQPLVTEWIKK